MSLSPPPASSSCSGEFRALEAVSQFPFSLPITLSPSIQSHLPNFVAACGTAAPWHAMNVPNPFPVKFKSYFKFGKFVCKDVIHIHDFINKLCIFTSVLLRLFFKNRSKAFKVILWLRNFPVKSGNLRSDESGAMSCTAIHCLEFTDL